MTIQQPIRGIRHVRAESEPSVLARQIKEAFLEHRDKIDNRMTEIQAQVADLAGRQAGLSLNGGGAPVQGGLREVGAALRSLIRNGDDAPLASLITANASMSVGSDPDGGYAVIPTFSTEITRRVRELSPIRQLARVLEVSSDRFEELLDLDEAEANWVGETQARPETSTPRLGRIEIPVHEIYAMPKVTQKLLDDSQIDIASWLVEKCTERFARKEGPAFVSGDGVGKPRGFLTYPTAATPDASRAWGTFQHLNTGTSGGFGSGGTDALISMTYSIKTPYRPNAKWLMNRQTAAAVRLLKDSQGRYLWQDGGNLEGAPDRLLGFEVVLCEDMPDVAANSLSIAFGDFKAGYTIIDRFGLRLLRDPYSAKPHVLFYAYKRTGGDAVNFDAVKFLRFGS